MGVTPTFTPADVELLFRVFIFVRGHGATADADDLSSLAHRIKEALPPKDGK